MAARRVPPSTLDVGELRRHLGERREVALSLDTPKVTVGEVTTQTDVPTELRLVLESISGGIRVTGWAKVPWSGPCRRCLEAASGVDHSEVDEIFAVAAVEGETYPLDDDRLDLGPLLHDLAVLALPLLPLCRTDCPGPQPDLFPIEGIHGDDVITVEEEPTRDPRWAPLDLLRDQPTRLDSPGGQTER
jgi:uncharacterized protein